MIIEDTTLDRTDDLEKPLFRGIIPPLLTPLRDYRTLDVQGLERIVERLISGGVHGIFVLGTTGEGPGLSYKMRREIITRVMDQVANRVPIIAAVTDTSFEESLNLGEFAAEHGCKALVVSAPYYHPITQSDLTKYLLHLGDLSPLPLFIYNMPSHTKTWFEIETLKEVFPHPNYIGLKDSGGDMDYFSNVSLLMQMYPELTLLVGPEHLLVSSMKLGGHGGICGGAHLLPKLFVRIYDAVNSKDMNLVGHLERRLTDLGTLYNCFAEASFLGNLKCALALLGICHGEFAEPLHMIPAGRVAVVQKCLDELGITADTLE